MSLGKASEAALEHMRSGGKRVRGRLALSTASRLRLSQMEAISLAACAELIHNASLIHDDIQDHAETRRNVTTTWKRYGSDVAICAGDLLISAAYMALADRAVRETPSLIRQMHLRTAEVISGQCRDISFNALKLDSLEGYKRIAISKSAPLLALPIELALIEAGRADACAHVDRAASDFALAYQIADDLDDVEVDAIAGRPNIVSILSANHDFSIAVIKARDLAAHYFNSARSLSANLPEGCGQLLADYARTSALKLNTLEAVA
ncbi:MAG: polyprenyl synthetase family protein [Pseudomonadota bacterium]